LSIITLATKKRKLFKFEMLNYKKTVAKEKNYVEVRCKSQRWDQGTIEEFCDRF